MGTTTKLVVDRMPVVDVGVQHSALATLRVERVVKARAGITAGPVAAGATAVRVMEAPA